MYEGSRPTIRKYLGQIADPDFAFPRRPMLVPDLQVYAMPDGLGVRIHGAATPVQIHARSTSTLVARLQSLTGEQTVRDLLDSTESADETADLLTLLVALHGRGLLASRNGPTPLCRAADPTLYRQQLFWGRKVGHTGYQLDGASTQQSLANRTLLIVASGLLGQVVIDLAQRTGFAVPEPFRWPDAALGNPTRLSMRRWLDEQPPPDMLAVALRSASSRVFESVDAWAQEHQVPWIAAHDDGTTTDIGPLVLPGESACYRCLTIRARAAVETPIEDQFVDELRDETPDGIQGERLTAATFAGSVLIGDVERHLSGIAMPTTINAVYSADQLTGQVLHNRIQRVPRCPGCHGSHRTRQDALSGTP